MEQYQNLMVNACITLIPLLVGFFAAWLQKKTNQINEQIRDSAIAKYINILEKTTEDSVSMVSATYVKKLKESGNFNERTAREAFKECYSNIINILGENGLTVLKYVYSDVDAVIRTLIEKDVEAQKYE